MAGLTYQQLGAISAAPRALTGLAQSLAASRIRLQDTTTPEQREALAIARQRAASLRFPGQSLAEARLDQGQAVATQQAALGAGSSNDFLNSVATGQRIRANGQAGLNIEAERANGQAQAGLGVELQRQAQQRQRDLATYNTNKAALIGSSIENSTNAIDTGAAYAAYGLNQKTDVSSAVSGVPPSAPIGGTTLPYTTPGATYTPGLGLRSGYYGTGRTRTRYPSLY